MRAGCGTSPLQNENIIQYPLSDVNYKSSPVDKTGARAHTADMETSALRFRVSRVGLHFFEEPCISGRTGSGTVFFSGCDMHCPFCQNSAISRGGKGVSVDGEELLFLFEHLERQGAENINLVTPTPWTKRLIPVLKVFKSRSELPVVWNSNGADEPDSLRRLEGLVDVWLPDFKYSDDALAKEYGAHENYSARAVAALREMRRQTPEDLFDKDGMMKKGVIVRHLVLPGATENSEGVMREIAAVDKTLCVSVMAQYFPTPAVKDHPLLSRRVTAEEYDKALDAFFAAGLKNGFSQDPESATEDYVPDFAGSIEEIKKLLADMRNGF